VYKAAQETVLEVDVVVCVVIDDFTVDIVGLMIDMELELEEERICEEDEENRVELDVEDKLLYVKIGEMNELLGVVQDKLRSFVELDVVGNKLLVLLLE